MNKRKEYPKKELLDNATYEQLESLFWKLSFPITNDEAKIWDYMYKRYGEESRKRKKHAKH